MENPVRSLNIIFLSLIFAVLAVLASCNYSVRSKPNEENRIDFDTIRVAKRHHIDGDTLNPYCNIVIEFIYPVKSEKIAVDTLQNLFVASMFGPSFSFLDPNLAVEAYIRSYIDNYTHDAGMFREYTTNMSRIDSIVYNRHAHDGESFSSDNFYSYYESLSDSIVYNQYGILSFQVKQSNNKGGAASNYISYTNHVVNLNTAYHINENEIFEAGYDTALQSLIISSLLDQNNVKSVEELEDLGFFGVREIIPNSNFLLNDKGIIYTYNKGEYSAYQLVAPEVFIPYKAIRSLLRENTIVSKLADL